MSMRKTALLKFDHVYVGYWSAKYVLFLDESKQSLELELKNSCYQIWSILCCLVRQQSLGDFFPFWIRCHRDKKIRFFTISYDFHSIVIQLPHLPRTVDE